MTEPRDSILRVVCPCCNSVLSIDVGTGSVREWEEAKDPRKTADLKDATRVLAEEKARVEAPSLSLARCLESRAGLDTRLATNGPSPPSCL